MGRNLDARKFKFIGCEIIYREACYLAATGRLPGGCGVPPQGPARPGDSRHGSPRCRRPSTPWTRDAGYEAILLGYARCNDGLVGVTARDIPLVIPRAHDCITFFFGSRGAVPGSTSTRTPAPTT